ncbi:hypothetical protein PMAYCL1PPCAC_15764 [Pristionchus mayeri]|uniref:Uncharacterized protein n=1 Tax=Pristionchus mayeri TaxID=1317129 RepID=A0AAN5CJH1_9BILA|nr:hypothetical protein PMAYCL1PPCAC_15764 [Pristionchus mayeri]
MRRSRLASTTATRCGSDQSSPFRLGRSPQRGGRSPPSLNIAVAPIRYTSFHSLLGRGDDSVWLVLRLSRDTLPSRGLNASATTAPTTRDSSSELQRRVKKTWEGSVGAVTRGLVGSRRWMRDGR